MLNNFHKYDEIIVYVSVKKKFENVIKPIQDFATLTQLLIGTSNCCHIVSHIQSNDHSGLPFLGSSTYHQLQQEDVLIRKLILIASVLVIF